MLSKKETFPEKNNNRYYFRIAVFGLFLFFLPTQLGKHFLFDFSFVNGVKVDYLMPVLYLTDILFLILVSLHYQIIGTELKKRKILFLFLSFPLLLNFLASRNNFLFAFRFLKIVELYFLFLIFKTFKNEKMTLWSLFGGGALQLFLAVLQLIKRSSLQGIFYFFGERYLTLTLSGVAKATLDGVEFLRPYATFSHPNSLAGFYLLLYFYVLTNKQFNRFLLLKQLSLLFFSLLIFISFSKVAILTYLVLTILHIVIVNKITCKGCTIARIIVVALLALLVIQVKTDPLSAAKRVNLFLDSLTILKNNLFLGTSLGQYLLHQARLPTPYPYFFLQPVHNAFILLLSETGIILGGFIFYFLFRIIKTKIKNRAFLFCFLAVILSGTFDHYWYTLQQNWLLLGVIFGLL